MATIVEGEASESDEELEEGVSTDTRIPEDAAVRGSPTSSMSSRESSMLGKATQDADLASDASSAADSQQGGEKLLIPHKYKSVFQKKLVEEMWTLRGQVELIAHKSYIESTKQVKQLVRNADHLTTNLKKSAYQLQLLTNDLFRLEDKIDEVNQQKSLSRLVLPPCMTQAAS